MTRLSSWIRRWIDPLAGSDEVRYKTSKEIALENAARSLGAEVGEYYPDDWEIAGQSVTDDGCDVSPEVRAKGDADREEILLYVGRIQSRRSLRRRVRRQRLALMSIPVLVVGAVGMAMLLAANDPRGGRGSRDVTDVGDRRSAFPVYGPNGIKARAQQPAMLSERLSLRERGIASTVVNSAYVSQTSQICSIVFESADGVSRTNNTSACFQPGSLKRGLGAECVSMAWSGGAAGRTVLAGFAHKDVKRVVGRAPQGRGPLRVRLSKAWSPAAPGTAIGKVDPFKVLLVTARFVRQKGASTGLNTFDPLNPRSYSLRARLVGGGTELIEGTMPSESAEGPGCSG